MQRQGEPLWLTCRVLLCHPNYSSSGFGLVPPGVYVCSGSYGWTGNSRIVIWHLSSLPIIWCLLSAWLDWENPGDTRTHYLLTSWYGIASHISASLRLPSGPSHSPYPAGDKNFSCLNLRTGAEWIMVSCSEEEHVLGTLESTVWMEQSEQVKDWE